jgi:hypothetical protein
MSGFSCRSMDFLKELLGRIRRKLASAPPGPPARSSPCYSFLLIFLLHSLLVRMIYKGSPIDIHLGTPGDPGVFVLIYDFQNVLSRKCVICEPKC